MPFISISVRKAGVKILAGQVSVTACTELRFRVMVIDPEIFGKTNAEL